MSCHGCPACVSREGFGTLEHAHFTSHLAWHRSHHSRLAVLFLLDHQHLPRRNILLGTHLAWKSRYIWLVRRFMMTFPQMPVSFRCASIPFQTRQPTCQPSTRQPALCEKQPIGTRQGSRPPARAGARGTCRARCRCSARWANARPAGGRWLRQRRAEPGILSFIFFEWDWMDGLDGQNERQ